MPVINLPGSKEETDMKLDLGGKVAVVSGASRGIGREIARTLSREGMSIALVARDKALLAEAKAEVEQNGQKAVVLIRDLRDRAAPPAVTLGAGLGPYLAVDDHRLIHSTSVAIHFDRLVITFGPHRV